ncbi:RICIN domain-containing protein [Agromyces ramosus]|uniref:O-glycosyl hydrolase n=1 Tax=Agromyces ramosus TaxID=33879 RepID=A0ABU0RAI0_9MICO|nr:glycoside hydrolase [Agromyces ramosus]MDQ0895066.1 O-glycosyl hydrolase [Agromyces ramosus]
MTMYGRRFTALLTSAALATAALVAAPISAAPASAVDGLTITPNPAYAGEAFEGWGTSLVWFANATGGYPDELREELYQAVFGDDGLDLNIARYNIGGGNASDVTDYLRPGGAVEGWWAPNPDGDGGTYGGVSTDYADRNALLAAWNADGPASYDWSADETQRWWVERLAAEGQITHWETFANSAPYFMTESGYVSGGFNSSAEQLKPAAEAQFAKYLVNVTEHLEDEYGIEVETLDPFNEPNTNYWGTTLSNGKPVGGRQEGMHMGPARQVALIDDVRAALDDPASTTDAGLSAMDETNPGIFATNWAGYPAATRDKVDRMNVHTYGTSGRLGVRDLAKQADTDLWMSEIEGNWVSGYNPVDIENGLGIAGRIIDDLRELEPKAWVLWQPVEDRYNMEPQGENLNWGSIFIDLDCEPYEEAGGTVWKSARRVADAGGNSSAAPECGVEVNSKFNTIRNFTKFIHEGDHLIAIDDISSTAAVRADGTGATIVHRNTAASDRRVTIDLSNFGDIAEGATVTPIVTTQAPSADAPTANALVEGAPVAIDGVARTATVTVPAKSVTTFVIDGVSSVSADAPALVDGHRYQLMGAQSGKALTVGGSTAATSITGLATDAAKAATQAWTVHEVATGEREATRRVVLEASDGRVLGATSAGTDLRQVAPAAAGLEPATRWIVNTTDGRRYSLVNEALGLALEVGGQSTAEGAGVGVYGSNGGANQSWQPRDLAPLAGQTLAARTLVGVPPVLPETIVPRYSWGAGAPAAVAWQLPDASWAQRGRVEVPGTLTDLFGQAIGVTALVDVGGLTGTDPVSITVAEGASLSAVQAAAPEVVPARVGASENTFEVPAVWDWSAVSGDAFAEVGVVHVAGVVTADGAELPAQLAVLVTEGTLRNVNPDAGNTASASSTESGYPADRTRNGDIGDKGWSNWVSSNKPAQSTLTYQFAAAHEVERVAVHFFRDGTNSWAQTMQVQVRNAAGVWAPAPGWETAQPVASPAGGSAPVVVADFAPVTATGVRVVMNAYPNTHLIVSEVQVFESTAAPAAVSDLAVLRLDGALIDGFDPARTEYELEVDGGRLPVVDAIAVDSAASVRITQPTTENGGVATISVISADGSTETRYTIMIRRHAVVADLQIVERPRVGTPAHATATIDPGDGEIVWQWYLNGEPIDGASGQSYTPGTNDAGKLLSVSVDVSADGVEPAASESEAQRIVSMHSRKP